MKIAVVAYGDIPSEWAHSINTLKHANGFYNLGHEVTVFSPLKFHENRKLKKISSIQKYYGINQKIKVKLFKSHFFFHFSELTFFHIKLMGLLLKITNHKLLINHKINQWNDPEKKIADAVKEENFDLAYCRCFRAHYYLTKHKIPTILELHDLKINPSFKFLQKTVESKYFLGVSTISKKLKNHFINNGIPEKKVIVQEDAVDLSTFDKINGKKEKIRSKLGLPLNNQIITYCGSLYGNRGIEEILFCASKNKDKIFLLIGGNKNQISHYRDYYKRNFGRIVNLVFTGHQSQHKIPYYLKASDLLIAPYSKKVETADLMSPIKLFEYMASKVPIIVSNLPRIKKIVTENEVTFFQGDDKKSLENVINTSFENKKIALEKAKKAYELVHEYTYEKRCATFISRMKEICNK